MHPVFESVREYLAVALSDARSFGVTESHRRQVMIRHTADL